jgi:hypothetical protein
VADDEINFNHNFMGRHSPEANCEADGTNTLNNFVSFLSNDNNTRRENCQQ